MVVLVDVAESDSEVPLRMRCGAATCHPPVDPCVSPSQKVGGTDQVGRKIYIPYIYFVCIFYVLHFMGVLCISYFTGCPSHIPG